MRNHFKDFNKSILTSAEISKFKKEITLQEIYSVCRLETTMGVIDVGSAAMKSDGFRLVKGQLDI